MYLFEPNGTRGFATHPYLVTGSADIFAFGAMRGVAHW